MGDKKEKCCCGDCHGACISLGSLFTQCTSCAESPLLWNIQEFIGTSASANFPCCPNLKLVYTFGMLTGTPGVGGCVWSSPIVSCGGGVTGHWELAIANTNPHGVTLTAILSDGRIVKYDNLKVWSCLCPNKMTLVTQPASVVSSTTIALANGTWASPGKGTVIARAFGSGGGGGGGDSGVGVAGNGGGGNGYSESFPTIVNTGDVFSHIIGSVGVGGIGLTADESGTDGGTTTVSSSLGVSLTVTGGVGGQGTVGTTKTGAGGVGSGGVINLSGNSGSAHVSTTGGAGGNAVSGGGLGGSGGLSGANGVAGTDFGGGGGGGGKRGNGANGGSAKVEYFFQPLYTGCNANTTLCLNPVPPCCNGRATPLPRTLRFTATPITGCACAAGTSFTITWNPVNYQWEGEGAFGGCGASLRVKIHCSLPPDFSTMWQGTIEFFNTSGYGGCVPSTNPFFGGGFSEAAYCDPVHLTCQRPYTLGCCVDLTSLVKFDVVEF